MGKDTDSKAVDATGFINSVFTALKNKSFNPQPEYEPPAPAVASAPPTFQHAPVPAYNPQQPFISPATNDRRSSRSLNPASVPFVPHGFHAPPVIGAQTSNTRPSRKRGRDTTEEQGEHEMHFGPGARPTKEARRGGRSQRGSGGRRGAQPPAAGLPPFALPMGSLQSGPAQAGASGQSAPAISLDDMQRLFASFTAIATAMGLPPPPAGQNSAREAPNGSASHPKRAKKPCFDYNSNGSCTRGSSCPYEHSLEPFMAPQADRGAYGAANSTVASGVSNGDHAKNAARGRGERGRRARGSRRGRADFSMKGPERDASNTAIVVEQIPPEHFSEGSLRAFFSDFGDITEVTMQEQRRLAIVRYGDHESARRAYESPKTIFDNRFVKVYWFKPEQEVEQMLARDGASNGQRDDTDMIDVDAFAKEAAERQKEHEERKQKLKQLQDQKEDIEQKLKAQNEQRRQLISQLAEREPDGIADDAGADGEQLTWEKKRATEALRERLAAIEAQAESLGLKGQEDASSASSFTSFRGRGRGRGDFRARGRYSTRGRGAPSWRGGYQAFGHAGTPQGGVVRLDNRPRSLVVALSKDDEGAEWTAAHDEALRSYLFNGYEVEAVGPHPERRDAQVVAFAARYVAE
ncbi:MAG: hypothetical protein INR71_02485, partial [Terriglobus roseus]|nr:hypothetical protein [Terriglobus roseus]